MIIVYIIVFGGLLVAVLASLSGYFLLQYRASLQKAAWASALEIAEAGVNYYRWHLAHAPEDFQDGTGGPGPYVHDYYDPEGDVQGQFSLEITPPQPGSTIVTIRSTGWNNRFPNTKRTILVRYGIPSLSQYSFLSDASSWYGTNITVNGRIHSNNGIRMDGTNLSAVRSQKETYLCGSETGCSPPQTKPGVWGAGGPSNLWEFPVPKIDFDSITADLAAMKEAAIANSTYFGPSGSFGYHLIFQSDGTLDIYKVTRTRTRRGYNSGEGCRYLNQRIRTEQYQTTLSVGNNDIFFFEDNIWVEGTINGRATVAAARFPTEIYDTNIWIRNNLLYDTKDGSTVLGLIAQDDIYFVLDIPNVFEINAAMLAQEGQIIRHYYGWGCGNYSNAVRDKLIIYGAVMSRLKSYWNWGSGPSSGFRVREVNYDSNLFFSPPPYFPTTGEYQFISWQEE